MTPITAQSVAFGISIFTRLVTAAALGYSLLAITCAERFAWRRRRKLSQFAPGVSMLKPLKGMDPEMYESFRSHCLQQYAGEYELIFGVASEDDPAVEAVQRLQAEFPDHAISLILTPERLGTSGKVSNLVQMLPHARHDFLLVNDSDILVSPHYLTHVMACFDTPRKPNKTVGMVTALYRGRAHGGVFSKLEALNIASDFHAGVLVAETIEGGIHFGLGSTLAMRREALAAIGGFEAILNELADDYQLGLRIEQAGFEIALSTEVVETSVPAYDARGFWAHQLRWWRTVRDARKWGYLGLLFTFALPLACLNVLASGADFVSLWLLMLALLLRILLAISLGVTALRDMQVLRDLWLVPVRDFVSMALWVASFAGNTIEWRGERFELRDGKLYKRV